VGEKIYQQFKKEGKQVVFLLSHNWVTGIPGKTPREAFFSSKNTLVVGVRKNLDFAGCKLSTHFQLELQDKLSKLGQEICREVQK